MSQRRGNRSRNRRRSGARLDAGELWRPVAPPAELRPIVPAADPTALVRSLGEPPLPGQAGLAERSLALVVDRAANLASALAAASGLLAEDELDTP